ncbi:MAG: hypothetical protein FJ206_13445 [Gemmatimonadetes bacterium]|nr:hypothetical protein [Gemmatimonadota bacterium]
MRVVRGLMRFFGWLLTPLVAWAASFLGAVVAARAASGMGLARSQLIVTVAGGAIAGALGLVGWLKLLRRSPQLRETLEVEADGTPTAAVD